MNEDLTVEQLLNVMEKGHKAMGKVLTAFGRHDEPEGTDEHKAEALNELQDMFDTFWKYR